MNFYMLEGRRWFGIGVPRVGVKGLGDRAESSIMVIVLYRTLHAVDGIFKRVDLGFKHSQYA